MTAGQMDASVVVGTRVSTANGNGTVRFTGTTAFAPGKWIGVELEAPNGKNNGSVQGKAYFTCRDGYGVFVRPAGVKVIADVAPKRKSAEDSARGRVRVQLVGRHRSIDCADHFYHRCYYCERSAACPCVAGYAVGNISVYFITIQNSWIACRQVYNADTLHDSLLAHLFSRPVLITNNATSPRHPQTVPTIPSDRTKQHPNPHPPQTRSTLSSSHNWRSVPYPPLAHAP